jgi:hypothetical protein
MDVASLLRAATSILSYRLYCRIADDYKAYCFLLLAGVLLLLLAGLH